MDQDFSDITVNDTTDKKSILKTIFNIIFSLLILFAIFSIIITIINLNKISNNENGYFIYDTTVRTEDKYSVTTYNYLCYKIVKVNNNSITKTYFRFWFMEDIDY